MNATTKAALKAELFKRLNISSFDNLRPELDLHDGNKCEADEELFWRLCYKKCDLLTNGKFPIRSSAWSCCAKMPCTLPFNQKTSIHVCGGFGVSGDSLGNGCPHTPGTCLRDEEMFLNTCYKRCSLLTYGVFPHRLGAATCCRVKSKLAFLGPGNCVTQHAYAVGGGKGD